MKRFLAYTGLAFVFQSLLMGCIILFAGISDVGDAIANTWMLVYYPFMLLGTFFVTASGCSGMVQGYWFGAILGAVGYSLLISGALSGLHHFLERRNRRKILR
ncbi:MAG TPA: hypothetical protein VMW52_07995 [Phycisphaerae bacterium]|nr:hypothetical protein [Phycisphaerae bacterium]